MRILIADDHRLIVEGVKLKLAELDTSIEFTIAATAQELRLLLESEPLPTLAMIDLAMPGANDREHLRHALQRLPGVPVIVISGSEDPAMIRELLAMGVQGFIPKSYSPDVMLSAIRLVLSGGVYVPPMMLNPATVTPMRPSANDHAHAGEGDERTIEDRLRGLLTERQIDVLRLLALGKPNKVIARDLGISEGTVKIHLAAIFRALSVRNRVEAVVASRRVSGL